MSQLSGRGGLSLVQTDSRPGQECGAPNHRSIASTRSTELPISALGMCVRSQIADHILPTCAVSQLVGTSMRSTMEHATAIVRLCAIPVADCMHHTMRTIQ